MTHTPPNNNNNHVDNNDDDTKYLIKMIQLGTRRCPIILQSKNGPCPLLAIINTLTLRGTDMRIDTNKKLVSNSYLVQILGSYLVDYYQRQQESENERKKKEKLKDEKSEKSENFENGENGGDDEGEEEVMGEALESVLSILPQIQNGLNVNIQFGSCSRFESTAETRIFSIMKTKLVHAWVVDPNYDSGEMELWEALDRGNCTYTQAVEKVFLMRDLVTAENNVMNGGEIENNALLKEYASEEQRQRIKRQGQLIDDFLNATSSQMTHVGLMQLNQFLNNQNLAILFRNNHFSTICKYNGKIHLLCTDEGFVHEENVVWERVDDVFGDNIYCRGDFSVLETYGSRNGNGGNDGNDNIQMTMREEEQRRIQREQQETEKRDFELAMQLQRQEAIRAQRMDSEMNGNGTVTAAPSYNPTNNVTTSASGHQQPQQQQSRTQAQAPSSTSIPSSTMVDLNHTGQSSGGGPKSSVPHGNVPTIRQQRETSRSSPTSNGQSKHDKYQNQAEQLSQLNEQRRMREAQQQRENPEAFRRRVKEGKKKEKDPCSLM